MARVLTLARAPSSEVLHDLLRTLIVCGCAMALIVAGQSLPV